MNIFEEYDCSSCKHRKDKDYCIECWSRCLWELDEATPMEENDE